MKLEEGGDTDGRGGLPEGLLHDGGSGIGPTLESKAIGIGIWKHDDFATSERAELIHLYLAETSGCQPDVLGIELGEDQRGLLGFHNTDNGFFF